MAREDLSKLILFVGLLFFSLSQGAGKENEEGKWGYFDKGDNIVFEPHFDWLYRVSRMRLPIRLMVMGFIIIRLIFMRLMKYIKAVTKKE